MRKEKFQLPKRTLKLNIQTLHLMWAKIGLIKVVSKAALATPNERGSD